MNRFSIAPAKRLLFGGASSIIVAVAATNIMRIFSSVALTRMLDSSSYGVVGIITSVAFVMQMLSDTGIVPFVVRHKQGDDPAFLDEIWTIRLVRGAVLTAVMLLAAKPIAEFMGKDFLTTAIMAWSFSFLLDGLSSLSVATGVRDQQLWRLSLVDTLTSAVTITVSIFGAIQLHSYWAMIIGMLVGQAAKVVMTYAFFAGSRRRFRISKARSREIWAFSRNIAFSSALSLFILQIDKLFLARLMPLALFGIYAIATTLATAPEAIAGPYCGRVLYPAYARAAREARDTLRATFYDVRRTVSLLYALVVGGLMGGAQLLVDVLYDPRYAGVALYLQIIAIRVALRMPNLAAYEATIALGDTRAGLVGNAIRAIWLAAGGMLALLGQSPIVMVLVVATDELPAVAWFWFVLHKHRLLRVREELLYFLTTGVGIGAGFAVFQMWRLLSHR